jgi:hypothetical protein
MIFYGDEDEIQKEIDYRLDPDNFVEEDANREEFDLLDLGRIMIRSIRALPEFDRALLGARLQGRVPQGSETDVIQ